MPFRASNTNPNPPLFFANITSGTGTALGPALRGLGITTANFFGQTSSTPSLGEGLYFSVHGSQTFKVFGNSGDSAGSKFFTLLPNSYEFMPIKNPENLWIIGSAVGATLSVRGH